MQIFEDTNFSDDQLTMKSIKIIFLETLYIYNDILYPMSISYKNSPPCHFLLFRLGQINLFICNEFLRNLQQLPLAVL